MDIFGKNVIIVVMSNINLGHLISKFVNYQALNANKASQSTTAQQIQTGNSLSAGTTQSNISSTSYGTVQTANLAGTDRASYIKDLLQLPKNLNEFVFIIQKNLSQAQFQQQYNQIQTAQRNLLSQTQAQILAQLQGLTIAGSDGTQSNSVLLTQLAESLKNLPISTSAMINLADIASIIQTNGKDAITKLIMAMASAAKQGVSDLTQLKDTAKLINASVALASQGDNAQTLKTLLLLYLPWLPLQEGVGFDLEITADEKSKSENSILIITITTVNYGTVTAILTLESSNSVHVDIECSKYFPKDELLLRIESEEKHYSMQSAVTFSVIKETKSTVEKPYAKINMSNTNEINPFLLLMAHTIIRHTLEIDKMKK